MFRCPACHGPLEEAVFSITSPCPHCDVSIANVDGMLVAESPKIAPHRDEMRANIATALDVPIERVSLKATTNEQLGALGRAEGLAAMAVALVDVG